MKLKTLVCRFHKQQRDQSNNKCFQSLSGAQCGRVSNKTVKHESLEQMESIFYCDKSSYSWAPILPPSPCLKCFRFLYNDWYFIRKRILFSSSKPHLCSIRIISKISFFLSHQISTNFSSFVWRSRLKNDIEKPGVVFGKHRQRVSNLLLSSLEKHFFCLWKGCKSELLQFLWIKTHEI